MVLKVDWPIRPTAHRGSRLPPGKCAVSREPCAGRPAPVYIEPRGKAILRASRGVGPKRDGPFWRRVENPCRGGSDQAREHPVSLLRLRPPFFVDSESPAKRHPPSGPTSCAQTNRNRNPAGRACGIYQHVQNTWPEFHTRQRAVVPAQGNSSGNLWLLAALPNEFRRCPKGVATQRVPETNPPPSLAYQQRPGS